jgi:DNA topoisomerase-2
VSKAVKITDKFIKQLLETSLVANIVDWLEAKRIMQEERDKEKDNKTAAKANPKHVEKFTDASYKDRSQCTIVLCEGDSASGGIRNNKTDKIGVFPLRGKPLSCLETPLTKILNNKEFKNIRIITGLQIGVPLVEKIDGEWYEIEIDNQIVQVNENDQILINGKYINVKSLL